ncbi:MAG: c-type cytochrome [Verrucomicrobiales bacterium]|nr:c-type cytochrome [Verrucomicrobiales bacterium]
MIPRSFCACLAGLILALISSSSLCQESAAEKRAKYDSEAKVRIQNFTLPKEIKAELFVDASQTQNPGAICFDQQGRLYIAELHRWRAGVEDIRNEQRLLLDDISSVTNEDRLRMHENDQVARPLSHYSKFADRIMLVEDHDKDGRADSSTVWADGFNDILDGPGIGLLSTGDGSVYYTNIPHLWKLKDTNNDGKADEQISIQDGFGVRISFSGHDMHGLIQGPDGRIYWSIGDRGYTFTTKEGRHYSRPMEGAVFRCDPDGSNLEEYHRGLRNPQELAFDQYGNLFTCDNDADYWDTGRLVYVIEGGNTGWNHGHQALMNFREQYNLRTPYYNHPDHQKIPMSPWMTEGIWDPDQKNRPEFALPAVDKVAWGPSGLVYNYGVTAMPDRYAEHFWVCNFGGAKGDLEAFTVKPLGAGFALDKHEKFMVGLGNTDVEFGPDGKMYLCCFNNNGWYKQDIGNVYTLFDEDKLKAETLEVTRALLISDFTGKSDADLKLLLSHDDMRVRQRAQFELVDRNQVDILKAATDPAKPLLTRLHGIWGLGQLARKDETLYQNHISLLQDSSEEVRAQAAKILSDSRLTSSGEALVEALRDSSAKVKSFAAIGVGKCRIPQAIPALIEILAANENKDLFLRHGCIQGLWYLNEKEKILKLVDHESPAVRLAIALTLRKLEDPRVKYFLNDSDEKIRFAAIRAINDLDLPTAGPDLAAQIDHYINQTEGFRLPENHQDWIIQHRLINANFRVGTPECAKRLINYAASPHLPEIMRGQALDALAEWPDPTHVDPTVGFFRPLDKSSRSDITPVIQSDFSEVFEKVQGGLLAKAAEVALQYQSTVPEPLLTSLVKNKSAEVEARIGALQGLSKQNPDALKPMWQSLLSDPKAPLRAAASKILLQIDQSTGVDETLKLAESKDVLDRQAAYQNLAEIPTRKVANFFALRMATIDKEMPGAVLDLLQAAEKRDEEAVKLGLDAYRSQFEDKPLAEFDVCLDGGNRARGKVIFLTHAAGQCAKCHRIDKDGGEAGPDLTKLWERSDKRYILESLIDPNKLVVPGYGIAMVTLKDGSNVGGVLVSEDDKKVVLKVTDPSGDLVEKSYPRADVATVAPPVSAMPPMNYLLKKDEIRDLVAYLSDPKGKKKEAEKGHQ